MGEKSIGGSPTCFKGTECTRLAQTLRGNVPTINTVGILTAANPSCHQVDTAKNIRRNADLLHDLVTYAIRQTMGQFGRMENPYVIANLPRAKLVALGVKYGQDAVIFARRKSGERLGMGFELICTNTARGTVGHVEATRKMVLQPRKPDEGRDHPDNGIEGEEFSIVYKGSRFKIPFFDEDQARGEDFRGGRLLTYHRPDIPAHAQPQLEAYLAAECALENALRIGGCTGHHLYRRHGVLSNARTSLFKAMGDWEHFPLVRERKW